MGSLHFDITGDNSKFMDALRETETGIRNTARSVENSGMSIESIFGKLSKAAAGLGLAFSAQQFVSQIAMIRGEFQQLEVAFETMLGSGEKASALMAQITNTAAVTPFGLQDVANGAKQLLAYGVASEKVNETLIRLGDIAAGLSIPLNDLVYLYGTTMTQGRMFTQDLRQFQGRGIPLADELAKQFGVTKDKVGELVTAGKVGFAEMEKAIVSMTSEGGKFGGLMEAQSKTITGQISNIEDAIDQMFNEIGKSSEGIINLTLSGVSAIVENYELVGKALMAVVTTYGAYRAAVIANIALTRSWAVVARADAAAKAIQTAATKAQTIATIALNTAMKANPFVLVATGVVALGAAMWALSDSTTTAEKGMQQYNQEKAKIEQGLENERLELERLVSVLQDENAEYSSRREAIIAMKSLYPQIAAQFMDEKGHISDLTGLWEEYNKQAEASKKKSLESQLANANMELNSAEWAYNLAEKQNNRSKMKEQEERIEVVKTKIKGLQKDLDDINANAASTDSVPEVKNKSYWEKKKKEAEEARNALAVQEVNSKDWKKYTAKIIEADKELAKYSSPSKNKKNQENQLKKQQKISEELLSMRRKTQQDEINLMEEGAEKQRAQINLNYEKEIEAIEKQREAWKQAQGGTLTDEQHAEIGRRYVAAEDTRNSGLAKITKDEVDAAKESMNNYLKEYGSYMEKRKAITDIYTEKINKATTEGEKLSLGEQKKRELAELDDAFQGTTNHIALLFEDMSDKTIVQMREIADEAETILAYLKTGSWVEVKNENGKGTGKDAFGFTKEQFDTMSSDPEKIKAIGDGIKNVRDNAEDLEPVLTKTGKAFKNLFGGDSEKFQENLQTVLDGVGQIMDAVNFLGDSLSQISDAFGGNFLGGIAEGVGVATEAVNGAMSGAQAGAVFGPWGAAAGAAIGLVGSLSSSLTALHDKKHEKRIQRIQVQIEALEKNYEKLGDKIEDAYSKDASGLIEDQNKLLEQQKVLIQNQIKEEEKKKKTDNDRIKEWQEQIEEINKTIEDNKEKAVDAIFGSDLQSAIEDFASAYVEAWSAGEDKAKSAKDMVKTMIKNMVTESIKAAASDPMKAIREKMLEFWSDEYITGWEQDYLNKMATALQKDLDSQFGWADSLFDDSSYSQESSSKGFETMTQDQASELNGRFTALQISGEEIKNQMIQSVVIMTQMLGLSSQSNSILNDILTQHAIANGYLADLVKYSKTMATYGEKIDKIVENTQNI